MQALSSIGRRFRIRGLLGSGRLGTTYRAYDQSLELEVALKVLRPDFFPTIAERARLRAACVIGQRFESPLVTRILHVDTEGTFPHCATRLLDSLTLRQVLAERAQSGKHFGPREVLDLVRRITDALEVVHTRLPAHGLLRAENVLVLPGHVKLTDYQLATAANGAELASLRAEGDADHTLAPELSLGIPLSPASDVYALGRITAELLPSTDATAARALASLLNRATAEDPGARPPTPRAFADSLRDWLHRYGGLDDERTPTAPILPIIPRAAQRTGGDSRGSPAKD